MGQYIYQGVNTCHEPRGGSVPCCAICMKKEGQYIYGGGSGQGGHSPATRQGLVRGEIYDGVAARGVIHLQRVKG